MSEAITNVSMTACPVAALAQEASTVIAGLHACSLSEVEHLFELEKAASERVTRSPIGALFQLGIVHAHVDTILSHVPSDSAALPHCEKIFGEVQRMLHSVASLLRSTDTGGVVIMYYFNEPDPSAAH